MVPITLPDSVWIANQILNFVPTLIALKPALSDSSPHQQTALAHSSLKRLPFSYIRLVTNAAIMYLFLIFLTAKYSSSTLPVKKMAGNKFRWVPEAGGDSGVS